MSLADLATDGTEARLNGFKPGFSGHRSRREPPFFTLPNGTKERALQSRVINF
jgi:hypothetical protein